VTGWEIAGLVAFGIVAVGAIIDEAHWEDRLREGKRERAALSSGWYICTIDRLGNRMMVSRTKANGRYEALEEMHAYDGGRDIYHVMYWNGVSWEA
jgi:hypothetical protein